MKQVIYVVTDKNNKDRESAIIDTFTNEQEASSFAAEYRNDYGSCEVGEVDVNNITSDVDFNDLVNEIESRFNNRGPLNLSALTDDQLASAITNNTLSFVTLKERYEENGQEAIVVFA